MGLPVMKLVIQDDAWNTLNQDVWSDAFVEAELIHEGKTDQVQIRFRGGHTREYPKKSFEVCCKDKTIHLNAEYDDPSMIRNALSFAFFERIGVPCPSTQHCLLQLNERMLGVYLAVEGVDIHFFDRRELSCQTLIYAVNDDANFSIVNPETNKLKSSLFDGYDLILGNFTDRKQFERTIFNINTLAPKAMHRYLRLNFDVNNYLRWVAGAVCTGNYDGFTQNYAVFQGKRKPQYKMIPWDYEGTFGRNCFGKRCSISTVRATGYNVLTRKMLGDASLRRRYKNILKEILENHFTVKAVIAEVEQLMARIREDIASDDSRKHSYRKFRHEPAVIEDFVRQRRTFLKQAAQSM